MHEIIIWLTIIIIVIVQSKVALETSKKIDLFKTVIPDPENFETVKVYIRESQVKDIKVDYILNNLHKFQKPEVNQETIDTEIISEETLTLNDIEVPDYEALIWIAKDMEEKKIKYKLLKHYEQSGWNRI